MIKMLNVGCKEQNIQIRPKITLDTKKNKMVSLVTILKFFQNTFYFIWELQLILLEHCMNDILIIIKNI